MVLGWFTSCTERKYRLKLSSTTQKPFGPSVLPLSCSTADVTHRFAALQFEGSVLPQLVVQVVEVEAKGGRSLLERHVEVGPQLRHVQDLWLPDWTHRQDFYPVFNHRFIM